jgi:CHAD domain-containing protein
MRSDAHLRELTAALRENLVRCASDPDVDAVHRARTGARRIEAALEAAMRDAVHPEGDEARDGFDALMKAIGSWQRLLKKVRRAAGPVRDLDVQRKLLKKLVPGMEAEGSRSARGDRRDDARENARVRQARELDDALRDERQELAVPLKKNAAKWAARLDACFAAYAAAQHSGLRRRRRRDAARSALDAFARLSSQMRQLDAGNLHDFRKGAKQARYMAEAGGDDEYAGIVGSALKKLQDAIGDWHDWLMLGEEAHRVLGGHKAPLTAEIERVRDCNFETAMKVSGKMRGRLMGEWLDLPSRRGRPAAARETSASREPRLRVATAVDRGTDPSGTRASRGISEKKNRIGLENILRTPPHE